MKNFSYPCGCSFPILKETDGLPILDFNLEKINPQCPALWELFDKGLTTGIFQLETGLGKSWAPKLKMRSVDDLAASGALLRPSALNGKDSEGISVAEHYKKRKNKEEEVSYFHDDLKDTILKDTLGLNLYEEGSIQILVTLGGFSPLEAERARKGIKKKRPEIIAEIEQLFYKKSKELGKITEDQAKEIFEIIKASQRYSFCRSHSYLYGNRTLITAYLKAHFPLAFFLAKLKTAHLKQDSFEKISDLINDAKLFNINVKLPDIRYKKRNFWTDRKEIFYGLTDIKGIGYSIYDNIIKYIETAEKLLNKSLNEFSFLEFCLTCGWDMGESTIKLIKAGALDYFKLPRVQMHYEFNLVKDINDNEIIPSRELLIKNKPNNLLEFFEKAAIIKDNGGICCTKRRVNVINDKIKLIQNPTMDLNDSVRGMIWDEENLLGISITHNEDLLFEASNFVRDILEGKSDVCSLSVKIKNIYPHKIKTGENIGKEMAKLSVADSTGTILAIAFSKTWEAIKSRIDEGSHVLIKGRKQKDSSIFNIFELLNVI